MLILALVTVRPAVAVVCAFTDFMPNGPHAVGFAEAVIEREPGAAPLHLQWWFPAQASADGEPLHLVFDDYQLSRMRDYRVPEPLASAAARRELKVLADAAQSRGASAVRYLHVGAAAMLAIRDAQVQPGTWPLVWVGGDASFADQLASHGMVAVASPRPVGAERDLEGELVSALRAITESRARYSIDPQRIGVLGLNAEVPLAARLAGAEEGVRALAVLGHWPSPKQGGYWFDPAEIDQPTLFLSGSEAAPLAAAHPLASPYAPSEWLHFAEVEDAMLEFGLPNFCTPNYTPMARPLHSMLLLQSQYNLRHRLAEFFTTHFGLAFKPAPMRLTPLAESRKQELKHIERQVPAANLKPPRPADWVGGSEAGGLSTWLAELPKSERARLPARWWQRALELSDSNQGAATEELLRALEQTQPKSGLAAAWRAKQADLPKAEAQKRRRRALERIANDRRLPPPLRDALRTQLSDH